MPIAGDYDDLTFTCSSTRRIGPIGSSIQSVSSAFGSNVKALIDMTVDGETRTGIMVEGSRLTKQFYSQQLDSWTADQVTVNANDTGTTDPIGTNTEEEVVPSTQENDHFVQIWNTTFDASTPEGTYAASVFGKDNGYDLRFWHYHTGDTTYVNYDLSAPSVGTTSNSIDEGAESAGNSWAYCWYTRDINDCADYEWMRTEIYALDGTAVWFTGDGSSAYWGWQAQFEEGWWPSSIIPNSGTSDVTRAAANGYWDSGDVDSNLRGKITVYIIPEFSSEHLYDYNDKVYLLHFDDATQDIDIYMEPGTSTDTGRIIVEGASALVTSGNHTWSRGQILEIVIDPGEGEVVTTHFTTGNGTHSGTSWSTDDGDIYLGQSSSNTDHFYGVIFEPEYESAGTHYQRSDSDTIASTDSISEVVKYNRSDSDTVAISDSVPTQLACERTDTDTISIDDSTTAETYTAIEKTVFDTISVADKIAEEAEYVRSDTDTVNIEDQVTKETEYVRSDLDTTNIEDQITSNIKINRNIPDTVTIPDQIIEETIYVRGTSDNTVIIDSIIAKLRIEKIVDDTVEISDQAIEETSYTRDYSDNITITDSVNAERHIEKIISDTINVSDQLSKEVNYTRSDSDVLIIPDQTTTEIAGFIQRTVSDVVEIADSTQKEAVYVRSKSNTIATTDQLITSRQINRSDLDNITLTDQTIQETSYVRSDSDVITISDQTTTEVAGIIQRTILDALILTDQIYTESSYKRAILDAVASVEDQIVTNLLLNRGTSDFIEVVDQVATEVVGEVERTILDTIVLADSTIAEIAGSIQRIVSDTLSITDQLEEETNYIRSDSDTLTTIDQLTAYRETEKSVSDAISISDQISVTLSTYKSIQDNVTSYDQIEEETKYTRNILDSVVTVDQVVAITSEDIQVTISDTISTIDSPSKWMWFTRSDTDALTISEVLTKIVVYNRSILDTPVIADETIITSTIYVTPMPNIKTADLIIDDKLISCYINDEMRTIITK